MFSSSVLHGLLKCMGDEYFQDITLSFTLFLLVLNILSFARASYLLSRMGVVLLMTC